MPHLLHRVRWWLAIQGLQARARQLELQIADIEAGVLADHLTLARLRADLASTRHRLAAARMAPRGRRGRRRIPNGD